jgi:hypothetical protein
MSVGQAYLLAKAIVTLVAFAGGFFIMWNARERAKGK